MPTASPPRPELKTHIRLADGREVRVGLCAARHRALQIGLLHRHSDGYLEIAAGPRKPNGKLEIHTRKRPDHYLATGGGRRGRAWLDRALALCERHAARREEVFVAPAERERPEPGKNAVERSSWLWVEIDRPGELGRLWDFVAERPCQLVIESAGSGGVHAYWRLSQPLSALSVDGQTGEVCELIERANRRLAAELGADPVSVNRDRLLRLAGAVNYKTGNSARILYADFQAPGWPVARLIGDLPDPRPPARRVARPVRLDDLEAIPAPVYYERITGMSVGRDGTVRCPAAWHEDRNPSARVWEEPGRGWYCFACGAGGGIYQLASVVLGGPYGPDLRDHAFRAAKRLAEEAFR